MARSSIVDRLSRYQQVRWELERYLSGLTIGQKIMTEHELVQKFKVSRVTARKALQSLRAEGILKSFPGRGTFFAKVPPSRMLAASPTQIIGLLIPSVEAPMIGEIMRGVESEATRRGYHLILAHDYNDPERQIVQLRKMIDAQVLGILIYPDRFVTDRKVFHDLLQALQKRKLPLVLVDRYVAGLEFPCVMTDNVRGMYEATEHLICSGHRRPALIGFWPSNTVHQDRRKGFVDALREYGLPPEPVLEAQTGSDGHFDRAGHDAVMGWMKKLNPASLPFDSIVCMSDMIAHGAFMALRELGIRVPQDVALVGFDNINSDLYQALGLQLTSIQQPLEETGVVATGILIDYIEGRATQRRAKHVLLPPSLIVRTSCGEKPLISSVDGEKPSGRRRK